MQLDNAYTQHTDMKKYSIWALLLTLISAFSLSACDSSSDVDETTTSRDCLITSATLGTLLRDVHTKTSEGKDTTITYSVTGGAFLLYIDQLRDSVYNPDPLPVGTRVNKLVFASNGLQGTGTLAIQSLYSEQDTTFVITDSTDFSVPRKVSVYSADGSAKRTYTFNIRVYKEYPDSMVWTKVASNPLNKMADFVSNRTLAVGDMLYVFGQTADGVAHVIETPTGNPRFDITSAINKKIDVSTVQYHDGAFYALANGKVVSSAQGSGNWEETGATQTFTTLVGTSSDSIYAIANGQMWTSADGTNWNKCAIDTEGALPTHNITSATFTTKKKNAETMLLSGNDANGTLSLWMHDIDRNHNYDYPWILLPQTEELGAYGCPNLANACMFAYDGNTVMTGIDADGSISPFYVSQDNGRTWKTSLLYHPEIKGATALSVTVDQDNYVWIVCSGSGEVYKGRINRLGWQ